MQDTLIWGDGFADDGWVELAQVRCWSRVSRDECVRLFPALAPQDGRIPQAVLAIIATRTEEIVAVSRAARRPERQGSISRWLGVRDRRAPVATEEDAQWLRDVVAAPANPELHSDMRNIARFAYLSGVHPAYVWSSAVCLAYWGTTAAWLGVLARSDRAYMPIEVAEYVVDTVAEINGVVVVKDSSLADLIRLNLQPAELLDAGRRRLKGRATVVRRSRSGSLRSTFYELCDRPIGILRLFRAQRAPRHAPAP